MSGARGLHQLAAFATDGTAAIVPGEALDNGVIHVAPADAGQAQPACEVPGLRVVALLADETVADGLEMSSEGGEMLSDALDIIDDGNVAAILQEAYETADAADILRADKRARAVAGAVATVPGEASNHRVVDGCQRNASTLDPREEVACRAAVERECPR
jgi:hypothetical protein